MKDKARADSATNKSAWHVAVSVLILGLIGPLSLDVGTVPITLQSLVVFSVALVLRPRAFLVCIGAYLILGAAGLPVFAGHTAGVEKLVGPTAGFLWGFFIVGALLSWIQQQRTLNFHHLLICAFSAHVLLLFLGFSVLAIQSPGADTQHLIMNLLPGLLIKTISVALVVRGITHIEARTCAR